MLIGVETEAKPPPEGQVQPCRAGLRRRGQVKENLSDDEYILVI